MALPTSAFTSYDAVGNREDLSDMIYNIDPIEVPFMSGIPKAKANSVLHEWQTEALAAASGTNAVLEGDEATTDAATATVRLSNTCQISDKVPRVTGTQEAVNKAGRRSEMAHQVVKRALELRRDMETILLRNQAEVTGNATLARTLGAVPSWVDTNTDNGTSGTDGSLGNTVRTDGTQRDVTEALLAGVLQAVWTAGGDPDNVMVGAFVKRKVSTFTGNATRMKAAEDGRLQASISVYESDWGVLDIIPNRFQRARDMWIFQMDMWGLAFLRPVKLQDLAKTGDTERKQLIVGFTLESRNEAASGAVWDLNTS